MAINKQQLDTVDLQAQAKYKEQGITRLSNNDNVVERDDAGNILLRENQFNPRLIIEPIYKKIMNSSVVKVLDTQFNYFKFPVRIAENELDLGIDIDIESPTESLLADNITTRLTIPQTLDANNQPNQFQRINTSYNSTWYYGNTNENGRESSGYSELPFTGGTQTIPNAFTITEEILNTLREQNKTLQFQFQVQYRTENSARAGMITRLQRNNLKLWRPIDLRFYKEQNVTDTNNPYDFDIDSSNNNYPFLKVTYIVDINEARVDDVYKLSAVSGNESVLLAGSCLWDVTIVDIPNTENEIYKNIYNINNNTVVFDGNVRKVNKNVATNQIATVISD